MWEGGVEPDTEIKIFFFFFPPGWLELAKKLMETTHFMP